MLLSTRRRQELLGEVYTEGNWKLHVTVCGHLGGIATTIQGHSKNPSMMMGLPLSIELKKLLITDAIVRKGKN